MKNNHNHFVEIKKEVTQALMIHRLSCLQNDSSFKKALFNHLLFNQGLIGVKVTFQSSNSKYCPLLQQFVDCSECGSYIHRNLNVLQFL